MQIKLIFTRKVVHLASFWKWGFLELGSGLLGSWLVMQLVIHSHTRLLRETRKLSVLSFHWDGYPVQYSLNVLTKLFFSIQVDWMWVISQSSWPVWTALTGMTFVKKITSQFIQQLRCSGESYFKNKLKSLNLKYISYSVRTFGGSFRLKQWLKITTNRFFCKFWAHLGCSERIADINYPCRYR